MSEGNGSKGPRRTPGNGRGVLANLPSTRPQRPSARREAARPAATVTEAKPRATKKSSRSAASRSAPTRSAAKAPKPAKTPRSPVEPAPATRASRPAVPRQGFAADGDPPPGVSVQPPTSSEMLTSAAGLLGELAQAGLAGGARALKGALGRLPGL